jgi:hypothetical protein
MSDDLPELPSFDDLRNAAKQRLDYFTRVRDEAQVEVDAAQAVLAAVNGFTTATPAEEIRVSDRAYFQVLAELAKHSYAAVITLKNGTGLSQSQVNRCLRKGRTLRHVDVKLVRAGKHQYRITDQGREATKDYKVRNP